MNARIAILAALPREIAPLVRNWPIHSASSKDGTEIWQCAGAIAVCAGMGRERIAHALDVASKYGPLHSILSVGYAGALRAGIEKGKVFWPALVIDAETQEQFECTGGMGTLVTVDHVLRREEKPKFAQRWNADLVDMEAATVARLAQIENIPYRTLRVVSDEAGDKLPDLNRFIDARGAFREIAFAAYIALHPWLIPSAIHLGRQSALASKKIAETLRQAFDLPA